MFIVQFDDVCLELTLFIFLALLKAASCFHARSSNHLDTDFHVYFMKSLSRFYSDKISKLMGGPNTSAYVTIIRNPVNVFVSSWEYYKLGGHYNMTLG